ncbi:MAG: hypothetical protein HY817_05985 [Candidatus Abawacabacteria bacterium]|nr:hypothetical protein [Candidatus Abawacabacteria bacterium]
MIVKIARYSIREDTHSTVSAAIREFVQLIKQYEPDTYYEAFSLLDSLDFIHVMKFPNAQAEQKHRFADYTQKFVAILYPLCAQLPVFTDCSLIE